MKLPRTVNGVDEVSCRLAAVRTAIRGILEGDLDADLTLPYVDLMVIDVQTRLGGPSRERCRRS